MFSAFSYREYRLYWLGGAFSNLGMWALIFGRLWLMHSLTESPLYLGLVTTASLAPVLIFSALGGVIADRVNRLRLVIITRMCFAVMAITTGVLISISWINPWQLLVLAGISGLLLAFDIPSRQSMLPKLIPRELLVNGIALYSLLFSASAIIGPGFFAPLVHFGGIDGVFYIIGGSYVFTVLVMLLMDPKLHHRDNLGYGFMEGLVGGMKYVKGNDLILTLIIVAVFFGTFGMSFETLIPMVAGNLLAGGVDVYSAMLLWLGLGGLSGTAVIASFGNLKNSPMFLLISGASFGIGVFLFAQITWFPGVATMLWLTGGSMVIFMTVNNTLVQSLVRDEFRGRVMSIHQLSWGMTAVGGICIGIAADWFGTGMAISIFGLVVTMSTVGLTLRKLRDLQSIDLP